MSVHRLRNAYDAWWFLYYHPKLSVPGRVPVEKGHRLSGKKGVLNISEKKIYRLSTDRGGNLWMACKRLKLRAIECNLDIHWAKVDSTRVVNDNPKLNTNVEVWLELGPMYYGYCQPEFEADQDHDRDYLINYHDINLDCGAPTFDEALLILAKLVRRHYGDYREEQD
ncbi:MAG: hypothetical protein WBE13_04875 [Candidatus Acidiferrum sp.]